MFCPFCESADVTMVEFWAGNDPPWETTAELKCNDCGATAALAGRWEDEVTRTDVDERRPS